VKVQRFLLTTEKCLPFCWNSVTASASDGTELTLTADEIATVAAIYEGVKPLYHFGFGRNEVSADDAILTPPAGYDPNNAQHAANPFDTSGGVPFPTTDLTDHETAAQPDDEMPF